tara:strand:- start:986 stop:3145 length:2160 start_codon:yes stop_codon:yes gene_type:complete
MTEKKVNISIDGKEHSVEEGQMLIEVTDQLGVYIPRFCYHKKLSIAANCRMCLVEEEHTKNAIPACATPVSEGMVIKTKSKNSQTAQQATMEFLLINHPLDCPICDQGGECELQDLAYLYGKNSSRFDIQKQTKPNDNLGPLISTDMSRCIMCTRCVRFGTEVAGLPEIGTMGRGESSTISTFVESSIDHELSGNIIDLCPVGALNNKPYRYTDRTWELDQIDSISPHDCAGSNIHLHVKNNLIKRVVPKVNESINETWISDRDRFAFDGIYSEERAYDSLMRRNNELTHVNQNEGISMFIDKLQAIKDKNSISALVSPSSSFEEQLLFAHLMKENQVSNIDHRINQIDFSGDALDPLFPSLNIPLNEIQDMDSILIIGSTIRKETPIIAHWIKKAADRNCEIHIINHSLDEYHFPIENYLLSETSLIAENTGLIVKAALSLMNKELPDHILDDLSKLKEPSPAHIKTASSLISKKSLVISGLVARNNKYYSLIRSYIDILSSMTDSFSGEITFSANSAGAYISGCIPHRSSFGRTKDIGLNALQLINNNNQMLILYNIEPDDCMFKDELVKAVHSAETVVVFTPFMNDVFSEHADIIIPIKTPYEICGSFINVSGVLQSFNLDLVQQNSIQYNQDILFDTLDYAEAEPLPFDNIISKTQLFIAETKANINPNTELPSIKSSADHLGSSYNFNLYNIDSIVRRSEPLQLTKESKIETES